MLGTFALNELAALQSDPDYDPHDEQFVVTRIDVSRGVTDGRTATIELSAVFVEHAMHRLHGCSCTIEVSCRIEIVASIESLGSSTTKLSGSIIALSVSCRDFNDPPVRFEPPRLVGKFSLILDEKNFSRKGIFDFYDLKERAHNDYLRSEARVNVEEFFKKME